MVYPETLFQHELKTNQSVFAAPEQSLQTDYKRVDRVCWSFCKDSNKLHVHDAARK